MTAELQSRAHGSGESRSHQRSAEGTAKPVAREEQCGEAVAGDGQQAESDRDPWAEVAFAEGEAGRQFVDGINVFGAHLSRNSVAVTLALAACSAAVATEGGFHFIFGYATGAVQYGVVRLLLRSEWRDSSRQRRSGPSNFWSDEPLAQSFRTLGPALAVGRVVLLATSLSVALAPDALRLQAPLPVGSLLLCMVAGFMSFASDVSNAPRKVKS